MVAEDDWQSKPAGISKGEYKIGGSYKPFSEITLPGPKVGDRIIFTDGWRVVNEQIVTAQTPWTSNKDGYTSFTYEPRCRPVTKADGRRTREQRKMLWRMRWSWVKRRVRAWFGVRDPAPEPVEQVVEPEVWPPPGSVDDIMGWGRE